MASRTLIDVFDDRVAASGDSAALCYFDQGHWRTVSFAEWYRSATLLAAGLVALGVEAGARVAVLSRSRPEWVYGDLGVLMAGGVSVPVFPTNRARQCRIILDDAQSSAVLCEDYTQLRKLLDDRSAAVKHVVVFDERGDDVDASRALLAQGRETFETCCTLGELLERGARALSMDANVLQRRRRDVTADTLASLVYTAGTTGRPRGVELTHGAFVAQLDANGLAVPIDDRDEQVLVLPLAQVFARVILLTAMSAGCVTTFSRGFAQFQADLQERRPTLIVGVPKVFDALYRSWRLRWARGAVGDRLVEHIRKLALRKARTQEGEGAPNRWTGVQLSLLNLGAFRDVRRMLGGRLRFAITGGAPMPVELAEFFVGAGVPVIEGYGLTETCAAVSVQRVSDRRPGSVGPPLPGVHVEIAEDGEILVGGPILMRGYWGLPQDTAAVLEDGLLRTGDVGRLEDGHLYITDRKKDLIITAGGRNIAPMPLEEALQELPLVGHAVVHGDARDYLTALVTVDADAGMRWAEQQGLAPLSLDALVESAALYSEIDASIRKLNGELPPAEAIRRFAILPGDFRLESGELTETGKKRRTFVTRKYRAVLDSLYEP